MTQPTTDCETKLKRRVIPARGMKMTNTIETTVCGLTIQRDASGVGHAWRNADLDDIPANIVEEIEGEILDGGQDSCTDFVASNGQHYRW